MNEMKRFIYSIMLCFLVSTMSCSSLKETRKVSPSIALQVYQFEQLDSLMQIEPRPISIFLHAPWCTYCKQMEQTTLKKQDIIRQLNEAYYFVSFDGESQEDVTFQGKTFSYKPNGRYSGTHELAYALGSVDGELAYPGFIILNPEYEIIFQHHAFLNELELKTVLQAALL